MKKLAFKLLLFLGVIVVLSSCSKEVFLEMDEESVADATKSTLIVRTRAGVEATGDAVVSYPVTIYVFNSAGGCVAVTTIEDGDTPVSLTLTEGMYNVYAVAGASAEDYILPMEESATGQSVVTLRDGKQHGDIMTATNTVTLVDGETNTLTLSLERKVLLLQDVTINEVPSSVTAVSVTIAPLYENLCVNGTLTGNNGSQTVVLTKQGDTKVWKSTGEVYMLAASGTTTVSVKMTTESEITSYSYTCAESLDANYKVTIEGTYKGSVGVELSGTIVGAQWAGVRNIIFDFDDDGNATGTENVDNGETETKPVGQIIEGEAVPKVLTEYNGTVVFSVEPQSDNTTIVKVLAPEEKFDGNNIDENNPEGTKEIIDAFINKIAIEGINVWRLPTLAEIESILGTNNTAINNILETMGGDWANYNLGYFYQDADGQILSYKSADYAFNKSRVRAVATLIFK